jgi:hypothetical protein
MGHERGRVPAAALALAGKLPLAFVAFSVLQVLVLRFVIRRSRVHGRAPGDAVIAGVSGSTAPTARHGPDAAQPALALVASEDQNFARHNGFDCAIEKAQAHNEKMVERAEKRGRPVRRLRGASTISQQTAKNLFLWQGSGATRWVRKGLEVWYTALIEVLWPKRRILEVYANIAEFGDGIYGGQAAARALPQGRLQVVRGGSGTAGGGCPARSAITPHARPVRAAPHQRDPAADALRAAAVTCARWTDAPAKAGIPSADAPHRTGRPLPDPVIAAYNEADALPALQPRVALHWTPPRAAEARVLYIDDGSRDDTARAARARRARPRIALLRLSRNFGKEAALTAGLDRIERGAALILDADGQDPPELLPQFIAKWREGFDDVHGTRMEREGEGWLKRATAHGFYRVIGALSRTPIPRDTGASPRARRRCGAARAPSLHEGSWVGFHGRDSLPGAPRRRHSKFGFWAVERALEGITSFTTAPPTWG